MSAINGNGEAIIGGTYGFLTTCDREREKGSLYGTCRKEGEYSVLKATGTQAART